MAVSDPVPARVDAVGKAGLLALVDYAVFAPSVAITVRSYFGQLRRNIYAVRVNGVETELTTPRHAAGSTFTAQQRSHCVEKIRHWLALC